jgi:hypothetical protein
MSIGAFSKIASASATGGGNNIRDGVYKLMVDKVHIQKGHTGECFIAEFRVIDANANGAVDDNGRPVVPNAVGSSCSMVCNLTKHESAAGNAKAFVVNGLAGLGITEDKIDPEVMGWVCSEQNPLRGLLVTDETYRTINKGRANPANQGKPLTLNKWKPIAQTEADVQQQRAWLDASPVKADITAPAVVATQAQAQASTGGSLGAIATPAAPAAAPAAKPPGFLSGFLGSGK